MLTGEPVTRACELIERTVSEFPGCFFRAPDTDHFVLISVKEQDRTAESCHGSLQIQKLNPGEAPKATFRKVEHGIAFEYCNLHGLWKKEF